MNQRETILKSAAQAAENTSSRIAERDQEQLTFWEERASEIEQNCRRLLRAEIEAATKRLEVGLKSSISGLAEELRDDNLKELATGLEEPVTKMGDLIATLERVSTMTDQKLGDLAFRGGQMLKLVQTQQQQITLYEGVSDRVNSALRNLQEAMHAGTEMILGIWVRRRWRVLSSVGVIVLLTVGLSMLVHRQIYQPTWLTIEESNYWRLHTYDMKETDKQRLIELLKAKQRRLQQQNGTSP
jgi:chromosome segregation ATPase